MATGDETGVLTSFLDKRQEYNRQIWEGLITWSYDADDAGPITVSVPINGILLKIVFSVPVTTTTGTTSQLLIKDDGDNTIFDSGELAESATPYTFSLYEALSGTVDFIYEPSAAAGSVETPTVRIRGI